MTFSRSSSRDRGREGNFAGTANGRYSEVALRHRKAWQMAGSGWAGPERRPRFANLQGRHPAHSRRTRQPARVAVIEETCCARWWRGSRSAATMTADYGMGWWAEVSGPCSHLLSFDQRRRPETFFTAIATAFFWPTSTTSFLP